jgi:hypothetical protein
MHRFAFEQEFERYERYDMHEGKTCGTSQYQLWL